MADTAAQQQAAASDGAGAGSSAAQDGAHLHPAAAAAAGAASAAGAEQLPLKAPGPHLTTFGWMYNDSLEPDDNYLDLALAVSRNSLCEGGHMGCVFVRPAADPAAAGQLLVLSINSTLFDLSSCKSDVHAEQNAICTAARMGLPLAGATAYITMPPCKTCFGALQAAGVKRVVYRRRNHLPELETTAERLGIAMSGSRGDAQEDASLARVQQLWAAYRLNHPELASQELAAAMAAKQLAKESKKRKAAERAAHLQEQKQQQKQQQQKPAAGKAARTAQQPTAPPHEPSPSPSPTPGPQQELT